MRVKKPRKSLKEHIKADWDKTANLITESRLLFSFIPAIFLWRYSDIDAVRWVISVVFLVVVLTDMLDGYVARKNNEVTELGKLMDPFVDKVLIILSLVSLSVAIDTTIWYITLAVFLREASVTGLRVYVRRKHGVAIAAARLGKIKMVAQSTFVTMMLIPFYYGGLWKIAIEVVVVTMIIMTVVSGIEYFWNYFSGKYEKIEEEDDIEQDDAVETI